jgi:hypothetical protein
MYWLIYGEYPKIGNYPTLPVCMVLHMDRRECGSFLFSGFPCITNIITCSTLLTSPYIYISQNTCNQVFWSLVTCTHFYSARSCQTVVHPHFEWIQYYPRANVIYFQIKVVTLSRVAEVVRKSVRFNKNRTLFSCNAIHYKRPIIQKSDGFYITSSTLHYQWVIHSI